MQEKSIYKGKKGLRRIINAFGYSLSGITAAFRNEAAFRQIILLNIILIPITFFLPITRVEQALMIGVCLISAVVELLNSAIEAAVDRVSLETNPLSKIAKDMGSAAQLLALIMIVATWLLILI